MNDYIISVDENGSPYLEHYGVLGMKWGVRHDRRGAYQKATRKRDKLQAKAEKKQAKADSARQKARKTRYGITDAGRTVWENRQIKAGRKQRKADRATRKAEKWINAMEKTFAGIPLSELE